MLVKMTIASQTCWRASLRPTCSRVQEAHEPTAKAEEDGLRLPGDEDHQASNAVNLGLALEDDADFWTNPTQDLPIDPRTAASEITVDKLLSYTPSADQVLLSISSAIPSSSIFPHRHIDVNDLTSRWKRCSTQRLLTRSRIFQNNPSSRGLYKKEDVQHLPPPHPDHRQAPAHPPEVARPGVSTTSRRSTGRPPSCSTSPPTGQRWSLWTLSLVQAVLIQNESYSGWMIWYNYSRTSKHIFDDYIVRQWCWLSSFQATRAPPDLPEEETQARPQDPHTDQNQSKDCSTDPIQSWI